MGHCSDENFLLLAECTAEPQKHPVARVRNADWENRKPCTECSAKTRWRPRYASMSRVWLKPFQNGEELVPREFAQCNPQNSDCETDPRYVGMYSASVRPSSKGDDGERELTEDQIEGYAFYVTDVQCSEHGPSVGFGSAIPPEHPLFLAKVHATALVVQLQMIHDQFLEKCGTIRAQQRFMREHPLAKELDIESQEAIVHAEGADWVFDYDGKTYYFDEHDNWTPYLEDLESEAQGASTEH